MVRRTLATQRHARSPRHALILAGPCTRAGLRLDIGLSIFGVASFLGITATGLVIDRAPRATVLGALVLMGATSLALANPALGAVAMKNSGPAKRCSTDRLAMEYEEVGSVDGVPIRVPTSDDYWTCSVCGGDCGSDVVVCPQHGVQSLVDPFEDRSRL